MFSHILNINITNIRPSVSCTKTVTNEIKHIYKMPVD